MSIAISRTRTLALLVAYAAAGATLAPAGAGAATTEPDWVSSAIVRGHAAATADPGSTEPDWVAGAEGGVPGSAAPADDAPSDPPAGGDPGGDARAPGDRPARLPAALARVAAPRSKLAWTATVRRAVDATSAPGRGRVLARVGASAPFWGGPNVLLVLAHPRVVDGTPYLRVRLKQMPAGSAAWIPADAATVAPTARRVVIDLSDRTVTLTRAGRVRLRSRVVIGAPTTATPLGLFAVDAPVDQRADSELGPRVLALVAYSRRLARYQGGIPQVAIHAYERLGAPLGTASSHGCVRAPQQVVTRLIAGAPRGTPVVVQR